MTSKERVRATLSKQKPDRISMDYNGVGEITKQLMQHYNIKTMRELYDTLGVDLMRTSAKYIGPELKSYINDEGKQVTTAYFGFERTMQHTKTGSYGITTKHPLAGMTTIEEIEANYTFPKAEWFDYSNITKTCEENPDMAIILGHEGPFQMVTNLMDMGEFFMLMVDEPETAHYILDKMVDFELEYYAKCLEAGNGKVDIIRTCDDYGTQISMLFSVDMWREFFRDNTKRLVDMIHSYGAFFVQHSCGAVTPLIPELIECGVDGLNPLQHVPGIDFEKIAELYSGKIMFHCGVDNQNVLPNGTVEEIQKSQEELIKTFAKHGGYVMMSSQNFETDVPIENVIAVYTADRSID